MGIVLGARLSAVADMLGAFHTVADIGADHGRLAVALLQTGQAARAIASDISDKSLDKARELAAACNMESRLSVRTADGLSGLAKNEADALVIAGMGGALIARILADSPEVAQNAERIMMQPMRGTAELRYYLHHNGFRILDERIAFEAGRYYQLIAARFGEPEAIPENFPEGVYKFGWVMAQKRDKNLLPLLRRYRAGHVKRLEKAQRAGVVPETLVKELDQLDALMRFTEECP
ncbi:MAG: class I SAM-dependent methyltransferase [Eubacteriales bacterium]|nr:class I SAM-dependent methyltransferase [Eubacteriales bacterium]